MATNIGTVNVDVEIQVVRVNAKTVASLSLERNGNVVGSLEVPDAARVAVIDEFLSSAALTVHREICKGSVQECVHGDGLCLRAARALQGSL